MEIRYEPILAYAGMYTCYARGGEGPCRNAWMRRLILNFPSHPCNGVNMSSRDDSNTYFLRILTLVLVF